MHIYFYPHSKFFTTNFLLLYFSLVFWFCCYNFFTDAHFFHPFSNLEFSTPNFGYNFLKWNLFRLVWWWFFVNFPTWNFSAQFFLYNIFHWHSFFSPTLRLESSPPPIVFTPFYSFDWISHPNFSATNFSSRCLFFTDFPNKNFSTDFFCYNIFYWRSFFSPVCRLNIIL